MAGDLDGLMWQYQSGSYVQTERDACCGARGHEQNWKLYTDNRYNACS